MTIVRKGEQPVLLIKYDFMQYMNITVLHVLKVCLESFAYEHGHSEKHKSIHYVFPSNFEDYQIEKAVRRICGEEVKITQKEF